MLANLQSINSFSRINDNYQVCDFVSGDKIFDFLSKNPKSNPILLSVLLENRANKLFENSQFVTYQNILGKIEGVALVGGKFFFKAISDSALECFAEIVCKLKIKTFAVCEKSQAEQFYHFLKQKEKDYVIHCEEVLMIFDSDTEHISQTQNIEIATQMHLKTIVDANAEIIFKERGYNPLVTNAEKFTRFYEKLIDEKRCLVLIKDGEIACKVDLTISNSLVTYFEGFYVNPKLRRQRLGFSFMQSLINNFRNSSKYISLLVDVKNVAAFSLYQKCGYREENRFSISTIYPNEFAS
jgi:ribosomal protein S18 acetylase RimI-like enzyme